MQALQHLVAQHALAAMSTDKAPCPAVKRTLTCGLPAIERNLYRRHDCAISLRASVRLPQRHA